jgi:hypothetical protein
MRLWYDVAAWTGEEVYEPSARKLLTSDLERRRYVIIEELQLRSSPFAGLTRR